MTKFVVLMQQLFASNLIADICILHRARVPQALQDHPNTCTICLDTQVMARGTSSDSCTLRDQTMAAENALP